MLTSNQKYAAGIYQQVKQMKDKEDKDTYEKYGSMSHRLPVLIRTAGLAQALAFVEVRGDAGGKKLLEDMAEILNFGRKESLLKFSREAELLEYIYLTRRVLATLIWYKRFAQSVLDVESSAAEGGGNK